MKVRVVSGCNDRKYAVAGKTVGYVRKVLRDVINISPDAVAWVNGPEVSDNHVLEANDNLEFGRYTGQKGGLHDFWSESEIRQLCGDDDFERLTAAGLTPTMQPVFCFADVSKGMRVLADSTSDVAEVVPLSVDPAKEQMTFRGKVYDCDRTVAFILLCLLEAKGEIRSTGDIKRKFADEPLEPRLDLVVNRRLRKHPSGVGDFVESVDKRGYRLAVERLKVSASDSPLE